MQVGRRGPRGAAGLFASMEMMLQEWGRGSEKEDPAVEEGQDPDERDRIRDLNLGIVYANISEAYGKRDAETLVQNLGFLCTFCKYFTICWDVRCERFHIYDVLLNSLDKAAGSRVISSVLQFVTVAFGHHASFVDEFDMTELARRVLGLLWCSNADESLVALSCVLNMANHSHEARLAILRQFSPGLVSKLAGVEDPRALIVFWRIVLRVFWLKEVTSEQAVFVIQLASAHWKRSDARVRIDQLWIVCRLRSVIGGRWTALVTSNGLVELMMNGVVANDRELALGSAKCLLLVIRDTKKAPDTVCDCFVQIMLRNESAELGAYAINETITFAPDGIDYFLEKKLIERAFAESMAYSFDSKQWVVAVILQFLEKRESVVFPRLELPAFLATLIEILQSGPSPSLSRAIFSSLVRIVDFHVSSGTLDSFKTVFADCGGWELLSTYQDIDDDDILVAVRHLQALEDSK